MFRILILDDEVVICKTLEMMMRRMSNIDPVETFLAYDGYSALEILQEEKIDIILADLSMEEMDGLTFIENVLEMGECPQIIVVSAYGDYNYVRSAFKYGVYDYIMKPVEFSALETVISKCMDFIKNSHGKTQGIVEAAKKFVMDNLENNVSMAQVANYVSMDYSYFSKYFKRETGESFSQFLTNEKMKYCKKLLRETDIKVNILALKMGYNNTGNFSRAFRNYTGRWPTEYKEEREKEEETL